MNETDCRGKPGISSDRTLVRNWAYIIANHPDLARFISAQSGVFEGVLEELRAGRKRTHWMWFVFPQLRGLGQSSMAQFYGLASSAEARAYLAHPLLGPRLQLAVAAVQDSPGASLHAIFGTPDDLKFCSCMTLFDIVDPDGPYRAALDQWCRGQLDRRTLDLLRVSHTRRL